MNCNQHNLEQDFTGCFICSICNRIWKPIQPEEYESHLKSTIKYDGPIVDIVLEKGVNNELPMQQL